VRGVYELQQFSRIFQNYCQRDERDEITVAQGVRGVTKLHDVQVVRYTNKITEESWMLAESKKGLANIQALILDNL
jgi:hypothetical protein